MQLVTIDMETYWSAEHTLSKMSPILYIMHPETEIISMAIKIGSDPAVVVLGEDNIRRELAKVDWSDSMLIGHHLSGFDSMILAWRFGIKPKMWGCTLAMARPLYAKTVGLGLGKLVAHYELGAKDQAVLMQTKGRHLCDFTPQELADMKVYNRADTEQCYALFHKLKPYYSAKELWHIDTTIRMLVEPKFEVNVPMLEAALSMERDQKRKHIMLLARHLRTNDLIKTSDAVGTAETMDELEEAVRAELASAPKFAKLLESLGAEVPMKDSPSDPNTQIPALAKTDDGFIALQESDNELVAAAARARLAVKSTILETRIQAFLDTAHAVDGKLPFPLNYCGADTTGRWSGFLYNPQNMPRVNPGKPKVSDALRNCMKAPKGHMVVVADLSGIELRVNMFLWKVPYAMALFQANPAKADLYKALAADVFHVAVDDVTKQQRQAAKAMHLGCIAEGELVLTDHGLVPIESVPKDFRVWDGVEWVCHDGPIFKGEQEVLTYDSLTATPDHIVYLQDGSSARFEEAAEKNLSLARTGDCQQVFVSSITKTKRRVWDILNAGPRHRFTVSGRLVHNCGYGLGSAEKFVSVAKQMAQIEITQDEGAHYIAEYRDKHPEVVEGWKTCGNMLRYVAAGVEVEVDPWGLCHTTRDAIVLPSGRLIRYPELRQEPDGVWQDGRPKQSWFYGSGRHKARIPGSKTEQNLVQAVARDILADDMLEIYKQTGLRPVGHVHDELIYIAPENEAQALLDTVQTVMRTSPKWWPELVLWSEGDIAETYGQAK